MTSAIIGLSFALFGVWMQRHGRWSTFFEGLTGQTVITGSRNGSANTTSSTTTNTPPATTPTKANSKSSVTVGSLKAPSSPGTPAGSVGPSGPAG